MSHIVIPSYATLPLSELTELWRDSRGWAPYANVIAWDGPMFRRQFELFAFTPYSGITETGTNLRRAVIDVGAAGLTGFALTIQACELLPNNHREPVEIARSYSTTYDGEVLLIVLTFDGELIATSDEVAQAFQTLVSEPMQDVFAGMTAATT